MLAKINGLFRLTRDVEIMYTQSGVSIAKFGLACSEKYKDKETQLFLDAVAFGKAGEILAQYAGTKGTQIMLSGKLQTESWVDQNQQKRSKVSMTIEDFDFVSNKGTSQNQTQQQSQQQAPQQQQSYQQPQQQEQRPSSNSVPVIDIAEEDIPFAPIGLQYPMSLFVI